MFPFLKGGNSAFIAAIASDLLPQNEYQHSNNYGIRASYHFTIMALMLADKGENCTLKLYFYIFVEHFLYIDFPAGLVCTCKRIFQTAARKPRSQRKHQQLYVNLLPRRQFCCVDGLKSASPRALSMRIR